VDDVRRVRAGLHHPCGRDGPETPPRGEHHTTVASRWRSDRGPAPLGVFFLGYTILGAVGILFGLVT